MNQPPIRMPGYSPSPGGSEAKLSYLEHVLMENRNGLLLQTFLSEASGRAEQDSCAADGGSAPSRKARDLLGGDKNYDDQEFVRELRGMNITLITWWQNTTKRRSAVDERTVRHAGYAGESKRKRKRVEQSFGWMKMIGMLKKVKLARDREGRVAVYLHRSCLQPVSIAKFDGQNMMRDIPFGLAEYLERPEAPKPQ